MHCSIFLLVAALSSLGAAIPTPVVVPKACSTAFPILMNTVTSSQPERSSQGLSTFEYGVKEGTFYLRQDSFNVSDPFYSIQYLDFEIPTGSYGCQLHVTDANGSVSYKAGSSSPAIKIKSFIPNAFYGSPSYNDVVKGDRISSSYYGELQVSTGMGARVINSATCPASSNGQAGHLQFLFELRDHEEGTDSWFTMTERSATHGTTLNGFYMTYDC
ncbi:uncharacterized protein L3040_005576 [Drepanopeziza brunnea f. sp. 'multigermtubi']|uniref:Ubiquitin 3 binding protein But2 C-terminal domain-containing protein n=1 Tax=Marssonina brunnea f. sp. multigermtubi (strain MB_m1) TaxID=1072389 RepID=K1WLQ4_MARBU|nr:uncharacterized protein MBM_08007 [Drepanopeziza brunnea f. sp. 'multigermtubi' MB_m1]EKD13806.1 hypothetical protein MBM_08007 [Drepanopeziza brunnea f. sp. 'multigermtubi' MB_m1]KAJ5041019.1 hypothetical protein L3040_005576 [Drepanopeziza brunnea f. sp. 'multigermtubi']